MSSVEHGRSGADVPAPVILIVDDNPLNRTVLSSYLGGRGFEIALAETGEAALDKASAADLILLDVKLPGIDGFETCRRLKADEAMRDVPVIFMTAIESTESKVAGFAAGGVDYVTKPFQQEELFARVRTHLEIRKLTRRLKRANRKLQLLNASKDKFFSIVSHDLRTPFNALLGSAELMRATAHSENSSPEELQELADMICGSAQAAYQLLENLLAWSRLQRGLMVYRPECLELRPLAQKTVDVLREAASQKQIELINSVEGEVSVYADPNMLDTVIRNLTSNALKFTDKGGRVIISAIAHAGDRKSGHPDAPPGANSVSHATPDSPQDSVATGGGPFLEISISDNGVGMSEQDLSRLFRIDIPHRTIGTAKERGSGLGLILCKDMVERQGGKLWLESELEQGTTAHFTIPREAPGG
ncbi:MAG: hybrid sensor histidine kinase/response regulator [Proteobacteria bacterium]|nr:hybrid sensor histidine kinase/response regulator [Pseudomonadota bacterium]